MQQTCKVCGRPDFFNFDVPDEIWRAVVPKHYRNRVVCLACFDQMAFEAAIEYSVPVLYFAGHKSFQWTQTPPAIPSPKAANAAEESNDG